MKDELIFHKNPGELDFVQARASVDESLVAEYAEMMLEGVEFDPASAIEEDGKIYVWDGYHRGRAAFRAGIPLAIRIEPGTRQEAEWLALGANQKHGLRRNNADKRKVVYEALRHPNGFKLSDREIARHCGVHHDTVGRIRKELELTGGIRQSDTRIGADGRAINTAKIGQIDYREVWELERGLRNWLAGEAATEIARFEKMTELKQATPAGRVMMETLSRGNVLPGPRRKRDVIQAINNVYEQMRVDRAAKGRGAEEQGAGRALPVLPEAGASKQRLKMQPTKKSLIPITEAEIELDRDPTYDELRRAIHRFEAVSEFMGDCWTCGRCAKDFPRRHNSYNIPEFSQNICGRCLTALHRLTGPKPLVCPTCGLPAIKQWPGGGLRCECGARWPNLRAMKEAKTMESKVNRREQSGKSDLVLGVELNREELECLGDVCLTNARLNRAQGREGLAVLFEQLHDQTRLAIQALAQLQ